MQPLIDALGVEPAHIRGLWSKPKKKFLFLVTRRNNVADSVVACCTRADCPGNAEHGDFTPLRLRTTSTTSELTAVHRDHDYVACGADLAAHRWLHGRILTTSPCS